MGRLKTSTLKRLRSRVPVTEIARLHDSRRAIVVSVAWSESVLCGAELIVGESVPVPVMGFVVYGIVLRIRSIGDSVMTLIQLSGDGESFKKVRRAMRLAGVLGRRSRENLTIAVTEWHR